MHRNHQFRLLLADHLDNAVEISVQTRPPRHQDIHLAMALR